MRKTKIKNYLKTGILLFGISLFLWNCQEEELLNSEIVSQQSRLKVKTLTFNELKTIKSLETTLQKIDKKFDINKKNRNLNKNSIISNDGSFTILTDNIIEVALDSVTTYSFRIETPTISEADFENFVIKEENDNFTYYIYSYQFFENGHREYIREVSEDTINLEEFFLNKWDLVFSEGCWFAVYDTYVQCLGILDDTDSILDGAGGAPGAGSDGNTWSSTGTNGSYSNGNNGMGSSSSNNNNNPPIAGVVLSPQEIALIEIKECISPSMNASVWLNNQAKPSNGLLGGSNLININNYLQQNDCSQDAQDFVEDAIEAILNDEFENFEEIIIDLKFKKIDEHILDYLPPCNKIILDSIKTLENGRISDIIKAFTNRDTTRVGYNWQVNKIPNSGDRLAYTELVLTTQASGQFANTHLNSNEIDDATDLLVAQVLMHEAIHAYMVAFFNLDLPNAQITYASMLRERDSLMTIRQGVVMNNIHHNQFIRDNVVANIAEALKQFGVNQGYNLTDEYYENLAWAGLQDTQTYDLLPESRKDTIEEMLLAEKTSSTNGDTEPKGTKACN